MTESTAAGIETTQVRHGLEHTGHVGSGTWKAVLELWLQGETLR